MIKRGKIGALDTVNRKARVVYEELGTMVPFIEVAEHVDINSLNINSSVIVAFYGDNLISGVIIGVIQS